MHSVSAGGFYTKKNETTEERKTTVFSLQFTMIIL